MRRRVAGLPEPVQPPAPEGARAIWNVDEVKLPHGVPAHIMEIMNHCRVGLGQDALDHLHEPGRLAPGPPAHPEDPLQARPLRRGPGLLPTETTALADVVLPAGIWGEKTGTFTNTDRTVHISHKAVEPPGEARPDLEIFLDYARRMDFRDKDGKPPDQPGPIPRAPSRPGSGARRDASATTRGSRDGKLTAGPGSSGPATTTPPTAPSASTRASSSRRTSRPPSPSATTLRRGPRWSPRGSPRCVRWGEPC